MTQANFKDRIVTPGDADIGGMIHLKAYTLAQLNKINPLRDGCLAYCSDGDGGSACMVYSVGGSWIVVEHVT